MASGWLCSERQRDHEGTALTFSLNLIMRLSCPSNLPLFGLYFFSLTHLTPVCRVEAVRFNHVRGLFDQIELLLAVWCQFITSAVDFESPMFNLPEHVDFIPRIDVAS